jgi:hypothetical protein
MYPPMASPMTNSSGAQFNRPVDDILRARLKTLGVSEHRFSLDAGKQMFVLLPGQG